MKTLILALVLSCAVFCTANIALSSECTDYESEHPEWIFCDDYETDSTFVTSGRYVEYDNNYGDFVRQASVGYEDSYGMRVLFQDGEVGAGGLKIFFGRNPSGYNGVRDTEDFQEVFFRVYLKMQPGWTGNPEKLVRLSIFTDDNWSQAMIAHYWEGTTYTIGVEPVGCTTGDTVDCEGWNDFNEFDWLGKANGTEPIFSTAETGVWRCIEGQVTLDDPGASNGIQRLWIDGVLDAERTSLDFVEEYTSYKLNYFALENYWNEPGSVQEQSRYLDNLVLSTSRVGCDTDPTPPLTCEDDASLCTSEETCLEYWSSHYWCDNVCQSDTCPITLAIPLDVQVIPL